MRVWRQYWQDFGVGYGLFQALAVLLWAASGIGVVVGLLYLGFTD